MLGIVITVIGFLFIMFISYFFSTQIKKEVKSKEQKRKEILHSYETMLKKTLKDLPQDKYEKEKIALLSKISKELQVNIFFNNDEIKNIINTLAIKC